MSKPAAQAVKVVNIIFVILHSFWMVQAAVFLFGMIVIGILLGDLGDALEMCGRAGMAGIDRACKEDKA